MASAYIHILVRDKREDAIQGNSELEDNNTDHSTVDNSKENNSKADNR